MRLRPEIADDQLEADALVEAAFGPGRMAKAAERLREGATEGPAIAMVADEGGQILGVVRLWAVRIGEAPALFLGPIAVAAAARSRGLGRQLVAAACEEALRAGWRRILLVGDLAWFEPLGFSAEHTGAIKMPGPVDPRRLLLKELVPEAGGGPAGLVRPG